MALLVHSVVRRHMKDTSGFSLCAEGESSPVVLGLEPAETIIGWYRNPPPWQDSLLVFTSHAIWIVDNGTRERVPLRDIVDYESPGAAESVTGIRVRTADGFRFMRIAGSYGPNNKYKDFIGLVNVVRAVARSGSVP